MNIFNFNNSKFKAGDKVFVTTIELEGTIIDIENNSYMVEVYGDNMRRFVEVCQEYSLKRL